MKKLVIAGLAAGALVLTGCGAGQDYPKDQNRNVTSQFNNDWFCDGDVYVPQNDDFECWDDNDGHSLFKKKHSSYKRTTPYKATTTKPLNKPIPAVPAKPAVPAQPAKPAVPQQKQQTAPKSSTSGGSKSSSSSSGSKSSSSSRK